MFSKAFLFCIPFIGPAQWREVESYTFQKCFAKAGMTPSDCRGIADTESSMEDEEIANDLPLSVHRLSKDLFDCEFTDLLAINRDFPTCADQFDWDWSAPEMMKQLSEKSDDDDNDDDGTLDSCAGSAVQAP